MGEIDKINPQIALWCINMFCVIPCISTYMLLVVCLYSLIGLKYGNANVWNWDDADTLFPMVFGK